MSLRGWLLAIGAAVVVMVAVGRGERGGDFDGYWQAGRAVLDGRDPYDDEAVERYPPAFPALMAPFARLPFAVATALWAWIGVVLVALSVEGAARVAGAKGPGGIDRLRLLPLALAATYLLDGLFQGQSHVLVLGAVVGAYWLEGRGRDLRAGLIVGAAAALKLTPALVAVAWLLRGRWRALAGCVAGAAIVGGLLPMAAYGPRVAVDRYAQWIKKTREALADDSPLVLARSSRAKNQSPRATLVRLLARLGVHPIRVNVVAWPSARVARIIAALNALLLAVLLAAVWRGRGSPVRPILEASLIALGTTLLSPIAWTPYYMVLLLPYTALASGRLDGRFVRVAAWLTVVGTVCIPWGAARAVGCVTWPSVVLFFALAWELARPTAGRT